MGVPAGWISAKTLRYIVSKRAPKDPKLPSTQTGVSVSHIYGIRACHKETGRLPVRKKAGRPEGRRIPRSPKRCWQPTTTIRSAWPGLPSGCIWPNKKYHTATYPVLSDAGRVARSAARSRQRRWARFQRLYSNAMWHVDWHEMKNPYLQGLQFTAYLDDASGCVTGFGLFQHATAENSIAILQKAMREFGTLGQVLSDHGVQSTSNYDVPEGRQRSLTRFELELAERGIAHVLARVRHPQTNGKIGRFFRTLDLEIGRFRSLPDFIVY